MCTEDVIIRELFLNNMIPLLFEKKNTFASSQNRLVGFTFHLKLTFCFLFALLFYTESLLSSLCWQNPQRLF